MFDGSISYCMHLYAIKSCMICFHSPVRWSGGVPSASSHVLVWPHARRGKRWEECTLPRASPRAKGLRKSRRSKESINLIILICLHCQIDVPSFDTCVGMRLKRPMRKRLS